MKAISSVFVIDFSVAYVSHDRIYCLLFSFSILALALLTAHLKYVNFHSNIKI